MINHADMAVETLLASYPRVRRKLSPAHAALYIQEYRINRGESDRILYRATRALEAWMHRRVASVSGSPTLELGAGTLNHLRHEPSAAEYDVVEPFEELYRDSPLLGSVRRIYANLSDVPADRHYQRILSVAVLEHLEDLPGIVARSALLLDRGGIFLAGIPAEGGFAWGLAWRLSTGLSYRLRTGLPYQPIMEHEHLSSANEIIAVLRYFFSRIRIRWFPLPSRQLALYAVIEAREPHLDRCLCIVSRREQIGSQPL